MADNTNTYYDYTPLDNTSDSDAEEAPVQKIVSKPQKPQQQRPDYSSLIDNIEDKKGIPRGLLHAIVGQESGGNTHAVSNKGAMGLAQLIPSTAKRFGAKDPFDPEQNLNAAADYINFLRQRYNAVS